MVSPFSGERPKRLIGATRLGQGANNSFTDDRRFFMTTKLLPSRPNKVRDRAHEVAFADLDAASAQDVVGRGQMKIKVRHGEMEQVVGAGELQFVGAGGNDDLPRFAALHRLGVD